MRSLHDARGPRSPGRRSETSETWSGHFDSEFVLTARPSGKLVQAMNLLAAQLSMD